MTDTPAISTKDTLGEYDAIETAKPGEPLFPIQGGDPFGPPSVLHWAKLCREAGMVEENTAKAAHLLTKATNAEEVAWAMQAYQRGQGAIAEVIETAAREPEPAPVIVAPGTDPAQIERAAMIRGAGQLGDIAGRLVVVAEQIEGFDTRTVEAATLRDLVGQVQALAAHIEPRRGNERT